MKQIGQNDKKLQIQKKKQKQMINNAFNRNKNVRKFLKNIKKNK